MELRDQISRSEASEHRTWQSYSEVQQAALLVDLAGSIRRRLMYLEIDQPLARSYRCFAHAARIMGSALIRKTGMPFLPDPPFRWSQKSLEEVNRRVPEIEAWVSETVIAQRELLYVRHAALDLRENSRNLENALGRDRSR